MTEEVKTRGEMIAERLEKEADEMLKQMETSQKESEPEGQGLANLEPEVEDTPEEKEETVETSPPESQDTEESSQADEEIQTEVENEQVEDDQETVSSKQWEERYKNAQARMTKATQHEKELEKKISELTDKVKAMESLRSETKVEKQMEEVGVDLSEIMKDYPELVKPLQSYVDTAFAKLNQKFEKTTQELTKAQQDDLVREHKAKLAKAHPDYVQIANSEDFNLWLERQSPVWQQVAEGGGADDTIELLSRYKNALGITTTPEVSKADLVEKAKQNAEPNLPKARKQNIGSSKKIWTAAEIGKLNDKQFRKYEADIDLAHREGRVRP
jgi:DNA repair exonuclease SbcCD ATPase subunit